MDHAGEGAETSKESDRFDNAHVCRGEVDESPRLSIRKRRELLHLLSTPTIYREKYREL